MAASRFRELYPYALSFALAGSIVASGAAFAEGPGYSIKDTPATAPFSWTGFYAGVNAGYAWGKSDAVTSATCGANPPFYFNCGNQGVVQASGTGSLSPKGFSGGIQAGYNWQNSNLVYGAEIDFGAFSLKDSRVGTAAYLALAPGSALATSTSIETDWLSTTRLRVGWLAAPELLVYATGGLALTNVKVGNSFGDAFSARGADSSARTKAGWTLGGGAEWMVARNWTVKAEVSYVNFGDVTTSSSVTEPVGSPGSKSLLTTSSDLTATIARFGLNHKF